MKKFVIISSFMVIVGMSMFSFAGAENPPGGVPGAYDGIHGLVNCSGGMSNVTGIINFGTCTLMNAIVPLLVSLAVVAFIYGVIKYFLNPENEEKRKDGKSFMLWGLIALFVMMSIWALVGIFSNTLVPGSRPIIPVLPQ